jgi:pyruvate dehydrogenase E2 component (dihydrolipoyllysine-residue acetyltransferase)
VTAAEIVPLVMPKWGLSMTEGKVVSWLVVEGDHIDVGTEVMEVETEKIDGNVEATDAGHLRRAVAEVGHSYPVKALLGVLADPSVPEADIDAFIASYVVPAAEDEAEGAEVYSYADVDGIRVRYARQGSGDRTAVLIHGFGGDLDNWLFNVGPITAVAEVVAIDLPGHGQSTVGLPGRSVEALSAFVLAVLDAIGLGRVGLVGHSLGGAIAAQLALDHPERVASLAVIAPAGFGPDINAEYLRGFVTARSKRDLKPVLAMLFADEALVSRSLVDGVLRYKRLDDVDDVLEELSASVFPDGRQATQLASRLGELQAPLLVIWGADDQVIAAEHATNAPEGATVVVLDGAGHMVQMEKAKEVNDLLVTHLATGGR